VRQSEFTPDALAAIWREALSHPEKLAAEAQAAKAAGVADAAERLAELVMQVGRSD
jgi:UDP-N-acetylglucosamine--N-acetylmuramyl-(pentapeptide) pyrophosphoryl-undecaprenol N-acetylglucosamine transferase